MNKNFLNDIISKLKAKGCDEADVFYCESNNKNCSSRLGKIEKKENSYTKEIGVRAIINKRQAIISSTNFDKKNIDRIVDKVFEMAKVVPKNEYCGLANTYEVKKVDSSELLKLKLLDKKNIPMKKIVEKVIELEQAALDNKKIINSEGAEISVSKDKYILLGTNGLSLEFEKTNNSFIVAVLAGNNESMERHYDYKSKISFDELGNFTKIGKDVAKNAVKKINSRKVKTCKCDVIFDKKVSSSLLSNLFNAVNAPTIIKGSSFLKKKLGQQIFNKKINIIDNPLMVGQTRSKLIDCEGIQSQRKYLVKDGNLEFFFNSLNSAKQIEQIPTGHASRSVSSLPGPSYSNLYMENGKEKISKVISSLKKGFLVTELMGSSINYSNGDYSRGASGFWVENGQITYPVSEVTIAGNLNDIFKNLIVCNDLEFNFGVNAPSCLVENLTLGGK